MVCVRHRCRHPSFWAARPARRVSGPLDIGIRRRRRVHCSVRSHTGESDPIEGDRQTQKNTQRERPKRHMPTLPLSEKIVVQKL